MDGSHYNIEYTAYGTPFSGSFLVTDQEWDALYQELEAVEKRQEKLKNKGGGVESNISFVNGREMPEKAGDAKETSGKKPQPRRRQKKS